MIVECLPSRIHESATDFSAPWQGSGMRHSQWHVDVMALIRLYPNDYHQVGNKSSVTSIDDPWILYRARGVVVHSFDPQKRLLISDLGWSPEKAAETYMRLRHFEEDWNAPGMDAYDDL